VSVMVVYLGLFGAHAVAWSEVQTYRDDTPEKKKESHPKYGTTAVYLATL